MYLDVEHGVVVPDLPSRLLSHLESSVPEHFVLIMQSTLGPQCPSAIGSGLILHRAEAILHRLPHRSPHPLAMHLKRKSALPSLGTS